MGIGLYFGIEPTRFADGLFGRGGGGGGEERCPEWHCRFSGLSHWKEKVAVR